MIAWWWLIISLFASFTTGFLVHGLMVLADEDDARDPDLELWRDC